MSNDDRERSIALADQGFKSLANGDFENALRIAHELEQLRFTAAFDIGAQAYLGLGRVEDAIEMLERGLEKAPDCWLNWQLLGNCYSDLDNYEKAAAAYDQAISCSNVREDSVRLNQAILATRRGDYDQAIDILATISDPKLIQNAAESRITALMCARRWRDALEAADSALKEFANSEQSLGGIVAKRGRILIEQGTSSEAIRQSMINAIIESDSHPDLACCPCEWATRPIRN